MSCVIYCLVLNCSEPPIGMFAQQVGSSMTVYPYNSSVSFECMRTRQFDVFNHTGFRPLGGNMTRQCLQLNSDGSSVSWDGDDFSCTGMVSSSILERVSE